MKRLLPPLFVVVLALVSMLSMPALGQGPNRPDIPLGQVMPHRFEQAEIIERLGDRLPMDLTFTDHRGRSVQLGDYFDGTRPVILNLAYYECPQLCSLVMNGLAEAVSHPVMEGFRPGADEDGQYRLLTLSIDHTETPELAAAKRQSYLRLADLAGRGDQAGTPGQGSDPGSETWPFLTGSRDQIDELCEASGFGYEYVEQTDQYAHQAAIIVVSPDGTISRYLGGFNYDPRTFRLSLVDAADGKVGSLVDRGLLAMCYAWDPDAGGYTANAFLLLRLAAGVTLATLIVLVGFMLWLEKRRKANQDMRMGIGSAGTSTEGA